MRHSFYLLLFPFALCNLVFAQKASSQIQLASAGFSNADDESFVQRDFEAKKQVFGIERPWQMVAPYGSVNAKTRELIREWAPVRKSKTGPEWAQTRMTTRLPKSLSERPAEEPKFIWPSGYRPISAMKGLWMPAEAQELVDRAMNQLKANPPNTETAKSLLWQAMHFAPDQGIMYQLHISGSVRQRRMLPLGVYPDEATYLYRYFTISTEKCG